MDSQPSWWQVMKHKIGLLINPPDTSKPSEVQCPVHRQAKHGDKHGRLRFSAVPWRPKAGTNLSGGLGMGMYLDLYDVSEGHPLARDELLRMRQALEVTRGNILSIKNAVGIGVITYDIWLGEVEKALGITQVSNV